MVISEIDKRYFPGFTPKDFTTTDGVKIHALVGGQGTTPLLLVHGHPETHLMWRFIAPKLMDRYRMVLPDLRGYGDSDKPEGLPDHSNYSKRTMAGDLIEVMRQEGFERFHVAGHDRGARVLHRMIVDAPEKIITCCLMDILPTLDMYQDTNQEFATKYWHWFFYIQGKGFPETLLAADPDFFIHYNLNLKVGPAARANFPEDVLAEYTRCFALPGTIHGISEDYRASATIDIEYDKADAGKMIELPLLLLWGKNGVVGKLWDVLAGWKKHATHVEGYAIENCGHFVPEEQPDEVIKAMTTFMEAHENR